MARVISSIFRCTTMRANACDTPRQRTLHFFPFADRLALQLREGFLAVGLQARRHDFERLVGSDSEQCAIDVPQGRIAQFFGSDVLGDLLYLRPIV